MHYLIRCFVFFILLLLSTLIAVSQEKSQSPSLESAPEANSLNWQTFASAEGHYSIQFPGTPELSKEALDSNGQLVLYKYSLTTRAEYGVMYCDYPTKIEGKAAADRVLDAGAKGAVAAAKSELLSITEISLADNPGRELKERVKDGAIMRVKMFLVGQRLYQIAVTLPHFENATAEEVSLYEQAASRFLDSFKLTRRSSAQWTNQDCKSTAYAVRDLTLNGRALKLPRPEYPAMARASRAQGTVVVEVLIDATGGVVEARPVSGDSLLYPVSVEAARRARFSPTVISGQAVCVTGVIQYNFVLR